MFHVFNWEDIDKEFLWNLHTIYMKNSSHARGSIGDTQSAWTATCNKSIQHFPGQRAEVKHVKANLGHCTQQHFSLSNCFRNILQMFVKDKQILGKSEPSIFCRYLLMTVTGWVICTSTTNAYIFQHRWQIEIENKNPASYFQVHRKPCQQVENHGERH